MSHSELSTNPHKEDNKGKEKAVKAYPGLSMMVLYPTRMAMLPLHMTTGQAAVAESEEPSAIIDRTLAGAGIAIDVAKTLTSLGAPPVVGICLSIAETLMTTITQARDNQSGYVTLARETRNRILNELIPKLNKPNISEARQEAFIKLIESLKSISAWCQEKLTKGFFKRILDAKKDEGDIEELQTQFEQAYQDYVAFLVDKIKEDVEEIKKAIDDSGYETIMSHLNLLLQPVRQDNIPHQQCLENTSVTILQIVDTWIYSSNCKNIFWLAGAPGAGKSTIAQSVYAHIKADSRFASAIFCFQKRPS
ncbi:hypothetical protein AX16_001629 [Volvariella volvacea WC 439]|nr:hypothetical protein AX16_001629 [Volvariella volvacea WC 439]